MVTREVANPATINDLNDLIYMQDMTPEIWQEHLPKEARMVLVLLLLVMKLRKQLYINKIVGRNAG